jgi:site-specific DNA-methyltransferase (adenine-specific)
MKTNVNYNESNLETMAKMPDNFIDLTVTSPPYDDLRNYNGYSFDFEKLAMELYRVTKDGGYVVWVVGDATKNGSESGTSFKQALYFMECGFNLHDTMIYKRASPFPSNVRYRQAFEYMFVFSKGKAITFNPVLKQLKSEKSFSDNVASKTYRNKDGKTLNPNEKAVLRLQKAQDDMYCLAENIWYIPAGFMVGSKDKITFEHPATFPEYLAYYHILSWSNENDLIYDPFMGSGTVAKTAICANRNWIGSEISKEYCDIIENRLEPLRHNLFT